MKRVVVMGGGITGLAAAFHLRRLAVAAGEDIACTVIESSSRWGGKIDTQRQDGFVLERGPESMLARKAAGLQLIRELGLEADVVTTRPDQRQTFIVHAGQLVPMPQGTNLGVPVRLRPFLESDLLSARGKARALADLLQPSGWSPADESLGSLLRRRFGDELVDTLCEPLLAGIYAGGVDSLSADATFPQFREMERTSRSLILASRQAARATSAASAASDAQPGGATTNHSGRSAFITLRGGLISLIERLIDTLQDWADLRTHSLVRAITRDGAGYIVQVEQNDQVATLRADAVIMTTPANVTRALLNPWLPQLAALLDVPYVSTATVTLGYHQEALEGKIIGSGFVVPRNEDLAITACTYLSNKWAHVAPVGYGVIRCYVGRRGETASLDKPDDHLVAIAIDAIQRLTNVTARPVFTLVSRWPDAMPQYTVGHLERLDSLDAQLRSDAPGLFLASGGLRGVGLPDCIMQAQRAAAAAYTHLHA